jgi:hypothetical protein
MMNSSRVKVLSLTHGLLVLSGSQGISSGEIHCSEGFQFEECLVSLQGNLTALGGCRHRWTLRLGARQVPHRSDIGSSEEELLYLVAFRLFLGHSTLSVGSLALAGMFDSMDTEERCSPTLEG